MRARFKSAGSSFERIKKNTQLLGRQRCWTGGRCVRTPPPPRWPRRLRGRCPSRRTPAAGIWRRAHPPEGETLGVRLSQSPPPPPPCWPHAGPFFTTPPPPAGWKKAAGWPTLLTSPLPPHPPVKNNPSSGGGIWGRTHEQSKNNLIYKKNFVISLDFHQSNLPPPFGFGWSHF